MKTIILSALLLTGLVACTKQEEITPSTTNTTTKTTEAKYRYEEIITCGSEWYKFSQQIGRFTEHGYDLVALEPNATIEIGLPNSSQIQYGMEVSLYRDQTAVLEVLNGNNEVVHSHTYREADSGHNVFDSSYQVAAQNMTKLRMRFVDGGYITYAYIVSK